MQIENKTVLYRGDKEKPAPLLMQVSVYIILFQNPLQVRHAVEYLSSYLRVGENAFIPIILQSTWRKK